MMGPLHGMRVIDSTDDLGRFATKLLSEMGATVVRVHDDTAGPFGRARPRPRRSHRREPAVVPGKPHPVRPNRPTGTMGHHRPCHGGGERGPLGKRHARSGSRPVGSAELQRGLDHRCPDRVGVCPRRTPYRPRSACRHLGPGGHRRQCRAALVSIPLRRSHAGRRSRRARAVCTGLQPFEAVRCRRYEGGRSARCHAPSHRTRRRCHRELRGRCAGQLGTYLGDDALVESQARLRDHVGLRP